MTQNSLASWLVSGVLFVIFLGAGLTKLAGTEMAVQMFDQFGYPAWFMYLTGALEVIGAVLVVIPGARFLGGVILALVALGATSTHLRMGELVEAILPAVLMVAAGYVAWITSQPMARRRGMAPPAGGGAAG